MLETAWIYRTVVFEERRDGFDDLRHVTIASLEQALAEIAGHATAGGWEVKSVTTFENVYRRAGGGEPHSTVVAAFLQRPKNEPGSE